MLMTPLLWSLSKPSSMLSLNPHSILFQLYQHCLCYRFLTSHVHLSFLHILLVVWHLISVRMNAYYAALIHSSVRLVWCMHRLTSKTPPFVMRYYELLMMMLFFVLSTFLATPNDTRHTIFIEEYFRFWLNLIFGMVQNDMFEMNGLLLIVFTEMCYSTFKAIGLNWMVQTMNATCKCGFESIVKSYTR